MSSWELPSEDCQKFACTRQCLLCTGTQKWLWFTWGNLWMDDVDCCLGTSRWGWSGGEICMSVRGKNVYSRKNNEAWVRLQEPPRESRGVWKRRTSRTSGIVLHFLFLPSQKNPQGRSWLSGKLTRARGTRCRCWPQIFKKGFATKLLEEN